MAATNGEMPHKLEINGQQDFPEQSVSPMSATNDVPVKTDSPTVVVPGQSAPNVDSNDQKKGGIGFFEKFLSVWVLLCMIAGVLIGHFIPVVPKILGKATVEHISLPIAVLLWGMILPMMMQIDFASLLQVWKNPKGIFLTSFINYAIQPFTMYGLAVLFFQVIFGGLVGSAQRAREYVAGAVILGGSPCTAMVFVWSALTDGDASYTLTQVAVNDLILLVVYSPTVRLLLQVSNITIPWLTLILSVALFVLVPLIAGAALRWLIIHRKGLTFFSDTVIPMLHPFTVVALLLTLVLIFTFQAATIVGHPVDIVLIAVPLTIQTFAIWALAFGAAYLLRLPFRIAAPGSMIAASNFFELAVAIAVAAFGTDDGSVLVTTVGVLAEVPTMLTLVFISNRMRARWDNAIPPPSPPSAAVEATAAEQATRPPAVPVETLSTV